MIGPLWSTLVVNQALQDHFGGICLVGLTSHHANRTILIEGDPLPVNLRRSRAIKARQ